jgi:hypothetical protein
MFISVARYRRKPSISLSASPGALFSSRGADVSEYFLAPVDDEICLRMGRVVTRWAALEKSISLLLGTLLFAEQGGMYVVTNSASLSTQMKWIRTLLAFHAHEAEQSQPVLDLLNRAEELRQERNELVHGQWDSSECEPGTALASTINLDRSEVIRARLVTKTDLDELYNEINTWCLDYIAIGRKLGFPRNRGDTKSMFEK